MRAITVWRRAQYKTARVRFSQHRPTHSSVASNLPYLSINTFTRQWRPSEQAPRLRPPQPGPGAHGALILTPLEVARPPRCSGVAPTHPPPPLLRRAGANGRSSEISAATANGRSWPRTDLRTTVAKRTQSGRTRKPWSLVAKTQYQLLTSLSLQRQRSIRCADARNPPSTRNSGTRRRPWRGSTRPGGACPAQATREGL
jgi:hypothetical protein